MRTVAGLRLVTLSLALPVIAFSARAWGETNEEQAIAAADPKPAPESLAKIHSGMRGVQVSVKLSASDSEPAELAAQQAKIDQVQSRLQPIIGVHADVRITNCPEKQPLDAAVLPNGSIAMTSCLISACRSDDERAFMLAHELSHVRNGDYENSPRSPEAAMEHELTADRLAVGFLKQAGYDPAAALDILGRLAQDKSIRLEQREAVQERINALRRRLGLSQK